jgi:hypothetical protein
LAQDGVLKKEEKVRKERVKGRKGRTQGKLEAR